MCYFSMTNFAIIKHIASGTNYREMTFVAFIMVSVIVYMLDT